MIKQKEQQWEKVVERGEYPFKAFFGVICFFNLALSFMSITLFFNHANLLVSMYDAGLILFFSGAIGTIILMIIGHLFREKKVYYRRIQ